MTDGQEKTRVIITEYRGHVLCARYVGFRMSDVCVVQPQGGPAAGDIYIGKVTRIQRQINAAFLSLGDGSDAYLNLDDPHGILYVKGDPGGALHEGDEILVQVTREAHGTKHAAVSTNLMFYGRNLLLMSGKPTLGISTKIPEAGKKRLRHLIAPVMPDGFGVIVRTSAAEAEDAQILEELASLSQEASEKIARWKMRTCFSVVERGPGEAEEFVSDHLRTGLDEVVTDLPAVYARMEAFLQTLPEEERVPLRLYDSDQMALAKVYKTEYQIEKAVSPKVWLPSGAYLVIEQTEAMTVIDVNSGKRMTGRKQKKEEKEAAVLETNLEAAGEIARQIRLRNLSGIIVTDFIDLRRPEDQEKVLQTLRDQTSDDPAGVHVVDMTQLQLCEMTRKRRKRPLREQLALDAGDQ